MKTAVLRSLGAVATVLAGFTLLGCAAEEDPSAKMTPDTAVQPSDTSNVAEQPAADEEVGFASQEECLTGEWLANNEGLKTIVEGYAAVGGGSLDDISGEVLLTFDGGNLTDTTYTDWTFAMTVEGMSSVLVRNGTDSGTYAVEDDSKLTMLETTSDSVLVMYANGAEIGTTPTTYTLPLSSAPFTCTDALLAIELDDGVLEMTRN